MRLSFKHSDLVWPISNRNPKLKPTVGYQYLPVFEGI